MTPPFILFGVLALASACCRADGTVRQDALHYAACVAPLLRASAIDLDEQPGSYDLEVRGQRHHVTFTQRASFELIDHTGNVLAKVRVDRLVDVAEQLERQEKWLSAAADRSGVQLERRKLAGSGLLVSLSKKEMKGRYAGTSLLADYRRRTAVRWDWIRSSRYATLEQFRALQTSVWERLDACARNQ